MFRSVYLARIHNPLWAEDGGQVPSHEDEVTHVLYICPVIWPFLLANRS